MNLMPDDPILATRMLEESAAEQSRLATELAELSERARRAREAYQLTEGRMRATFVALADAARTELESIDAAHAEAVARLRADAEAQARSILAEAGTRGTADLVDCDPLDVGP